MHGALQAPGKVRAEGPVVEPDGVAIMQQARARNDGSGCSQTHRIDRAEGPFRGSHRIGQDLKGSLIAALGRRPAVLPKRHPCLIQHHRRELRPPKIEP